MRICFYLNNLWGISATARIAHFLASEMRRKQHEVFFVINKPPIEIAQEFPIKVLKSRGDLLRARELGMLLKGENVDVCYGFMRPQSNVLGLVRLFHPKLRTKLIGSVHNSDNYLTYNRWYHLPYRYLEKFLLEKNDLIVAVSKGVKEDLKEAFFIRDDKIKVIYNPIDIEGIRKRAQAPIGEKFEELFQTHPVIINIARMEKQKGLHHLINIFAKVNKKLPETRLVLIGDGSLRRELEERVKKLGLEQKVFFLGWVENPFPYLKRAKVFAMTSLWEGLAMVILESFALNIPVIAFKTRGGHVEVLENCCPLVDYPDEETYAEELLKIFTDGGYYETLRKRVGEKVKEFSVDRIAEEYLKLAKD